MLSLLRSIGYVEISLFVLTGILTWLWLRSRKPRDFPPGPTPIPLLGNLLQMADGDFLNTVRKLRAQYGDIFSVSLGKFWVIVVNDSDIIRDLLTKKGEYMLDRPPFIVFDFNKHHGIASANGKRWKENRAFTINKLRSFGFGKQSFESKIVEELEVLHGTLMECSGKTVDVKINLFFSISNILMSIVVGRRFDYDDPRFKHFIEQTNEHFSQLELAGHLTFFPFLTKLPGDPFKFGPLCKSIEENRKFQIEEVDQHIANFDENNMKDFIDVYIKEMNTRKSQKDTTFTVNQLQGLVGDLFSAGMETTVSTLRWWLLYMLHHHDIQDKMYQEICSVVGHGRSPKLSDKLPYCEAVIHETLRLGNTVPFAIPYYVTEDFMHSGYKFPKGAVVFISLDSALKSETQFPNSHEFSPDRFIDADGNLYGTDKVLAFSTGRRRCIGESLARMELFLYITSLIQRFEFLPPEGEDPPPIKGHLGITYAPLPYKLRVILRY